jgi:hypothetical protein
VGEVFDPTTNLFSNVGTLLSVRRAHGAAKLASGRVVLAGGDDNFGGSLYTIDVFDPATGQFARGNDMAVARQGPVAIGLPDGRVFVAGGFGPSAGSYQSGEIADPGCADAWMNRLPLELDLPAMKSRTPILRWNPLVSAWSTSGPSCGAPAIVAGDRVLQHAGHVQTRRRRQHTAEIASLNSQVSTLSAGSVEP